MSFHAMKAADQGVWVVDSRYSNHMTGCKEFFSRNSSQPWMKMFILRFVLATIHLSKGWGKKP